MSEQKPPEKSLADQRVDRILKEIETLKTELGTLKTPSKIEHEEKKSPPKHFDAKELEETACPDCQKNIQDWKKDLISKTLKDRAALPVVCDNCGIGVEEKEESCPACGGTHAHRRS